MQSNAAIFPVLSSCACGPAARPQRERKLQPGRSTMLFQAGTDGCTDLAHIMAPIMVHDLGFSHLRVDRQFHKEVRPAFVRAELRRR